MIFQQISRHTSVQPTHINPFRSFWMGGYECSDKLNSSGDRIDLLTTTGHLQLLEQDYKQVQEFGMYTVREGIRWSHIEKRPYQYDWSVVKTMIDKGRECGIQQVWDICHFGFPDDLSPLHPHFTKRFVALCKEFVRFYRSVQPEGALIVTPINEVSFLSWLGGEVGGTAPFAVRMGWDVKYALMRAYIQGIIALREVDPSVRILTTEPLMQVVPPLNATEQEVIDAAIAHEYQYQAMDILTGRICPELGGSPELLDMLGLNFYYNNQWVLGFREYLSWRNTPHDPRWQPMSKIMIEAYHRYKRPVVLSETSHPGIDRPLWIDYIAGECLALLQQKIPLWGVCLYPIIDRPDWDNLSHWHRSGLWDAAFTDNFSLPGRVLHQPYADALLRAQAVVDAAIENLNTNESIHTHF